MPFKIIRQDITKMECDAIVNPSNVGLIPGGGIDAAIHEAAGPELLEECLLLGGCPVGEARITNAFGLKSRYVIHTVGPLWYGGDHNERNQLVACYRSCLELAQRYECQSIAFPLISAGLYGYPKNQVISVALDVISEFLFNNEMMIYLVIFDKKAHQYGKKLFPDIDEYVDDRYVLEHSDYSWERDYLISQYGSKESVYSASCTRQQESVNPPQMPEHNARSIAPTDNIDSYPKLDACFTEKVEHYINIKNIKRTTCFFDLDISRQRWHKIKNGSQPFKDLVVSLALYLKLTLTEAEDLLASAGYAFSDSVESDVIIKECIRRGLHDVVDDELCAHGKDAILSDE